MSISHDLSFDFALINDIVVNKRTCNNTIEYFIDEICLLQYN